MYPAWPINCSAMFFWSRPRAEARAVQGLHPGYRIVTRAGELFEPDGTLTIGPARSEAGLVSRKSELRERSEQLQALGKQIDLVVIEHAELHRRRELLDNTIEAIESEIALLSGEAGDLQQKIARQLQHVEQLDEAVQLGEQEAVLLEQEVQRGEAAWVTARLEAEEKERAEVELRARLAEAQESLRLAEDARDAAQEANTAAQVTLSRVASERDRARERVAQLDLDLRKRRVEAVDLLATDRTMREKLAQTTLALLSASAGQAASYREKEHRERLIHELTVKVAASRSSRAQVRDDLEALRDGWQVRQAEAHAKELAVHDRQVHRDGILARIREDYGIDLAASESQPVATQGEESPAESSDQAQLSEVSMAESQQQIDELKRKLARLGSVNMEALEELARLEAEHQLLREQHDDLDSARRSLEEVIDTINIDSRKLFTETLSAVRGYFQELFRKLFGGGQADVVLEDGVDVLESGIEITARPPGKELRSLSLLSGGEKTLTAIALLLAIFRSKPSPFCILDEVDAALDEANTTRLAGVLARIPRPESVHRGDAQEADDGRGRPSLGRDHAGEWRHPTTTDAVRGLARRVAPAEKGDEQAA